jgi:hypothetical protein
VPVVSPVPAGQGRAAWHTRLADDATSEGLEAAGGINEC